MFFNANRFAGRASRSIWDRFKRLTFNLLLCSLLGIVTSAPCNSAEAGASHQEQQQQAAPIRGQVRDELGGVIVGAKITLSGLPSSDQSRLSDNGGSFLFDGLPPGTYSLRIEASGFADYLIEPVELRAGIPKSFDIRLTVTLRDDIVISDKRMLSVSPESNADAIVLRGRAIDILPDSPEALAAALQGLAAASGGAGAPMGGQIIVDGFPGGSIPPKDAIREVRINQNPYAAEFERPGKGRIEIFTKAGSGAFHGAGYFNFNDESLNARHPFAMTRAPYQMRYYGGSFSTPLPSKRASLFMSLSRNETDGNSLINAVVLDPSLNVTRLNQWITTPFESTSFNPKVDFRINNRHTLSSRYNYYRTHADNLGVGELSLSSRGYRSSASEHSFQLTETAILGSNAVNETGFQYLGSRRHMEGDNSTATLRVMESFVGGGAEIGVTEAMSDRVSLHNYTTLVSGKHTWRFGARVRTSRVASISPFNFGGTYVFGGGVAPQLDSNGNPMIGADGKPVLAEITSIERYRRTLELQARGFSPEMIRLLGGGATQLSISGGEPRATVNQVEAGLFVQDDWKLRPNLNVSLGLRYEAQTNISSNFNFGPRVALSWSPSTSSNKPIAVIRFGIGAFYERFSEYLTLLTHRYDGVTQQQFVVADPAILNLYPKVPPVALLNTFAVPQTIRSVSDDLRAPYTIQSSLSIERQLPYNLNITVSFNNSRTVHAFRSRNVNAPRLPVDQQSASSIRNIYEFESSGVLDQRYLSVNLSNNFKDNLYFYASYLLGRARSDTEGPDSFPANSYDLHAEYGRGAYDIRHQFYFGGAFSGPAGILIGPYITSHSGMPFDITVGRDINFDSLYSDRPAFATDLRNPAVIVTPFGAFDPTPAPGVKPIPRNYGQGPGYFTLNMFLSKTFGLGTFGHASHGQGSSTGSHSHQAAESPYKITMSVQVLNLLNRSNLGPPIGNLTSPLFGSSTWNAGDYGFEGGSPAGNRRIEFQLRFSF